VADDGARRLVVALTGASGAIYGVRFLRQAVRYFDEVYVTLSRNAPSVLQTEMDVDLGAQPWNARALIGLDAPQITFCSHRDYFTPPASGSFRHAGMVIIPCSMGTAGRIANGISDDLTTRAADVCLKEKRKLVLVVRETPLNLIHLRTSPRLPRRARRFCRPRPRFTTSRAPSRTLPTPSSPVRSKRSASNRTWWGSGGTTRNECGNDECAANAAGPAARGARNDKNRAHAVRATVRPHGRAARRARFAHLEQSRLDFACDGERALGRDGL
jgi:4-hydroxy-3-polyprenylbenzoate decarboxylase